MQDNQYCRLFLYHLMRDDKYRNEKHEYQFQDMKHCRLFLCHLTRDDKYRTEKHEYQFKEDKKTLLVNYKYFGRILSQEQCLLLILRMRAVHRAMAKPARTWLLKLRLRIDHVRDRYLLHLKHLRQIRQKYLLLKNNFSRCNSVVSH